MIKVYFLRIKRTIEEYSTNTGINEVISSLLNLKVESLGGVKKKAENDLHTYIHILYLSANLQSSFE